MSRCKLNNYKFKYFAKMKANKRKEKDVMKLLTSDYEIEIKEDNMSEFTVILDGPLESPYEGVSLL
jgi:ubiquitin-protein ligase